MFDKDKNQGSKAASNTMSNDSNSSSEVIRKVLGAEPLTLSDLQIPKEVNAPFLPDFQLAWRRESYEHLVSHPEYLGPVVVASDAILGIDFSTRDYAFKEVAKGISPFELNALAILSCLVSPDRAEFGVMQSYFEAQPQDAIDFCHRLSLDQDQSDTNRVRALQFIYEEHPARALTCAALLNGVVGGDLEQLVNKIRQEEVAVESRSEKPESKNVNEELYSGLLKVASAINGSGVIDATILLPEIKSQLNTPFLHGLVLLSLFRNSNKGVRAFALSEVSKLSPELGKVLVGL